MNVMRASVGRCAASKRVVYGIRRVYGPSNRHLYSRHALNVIEHGTDSNDRANNPCRDLDFFNVMYVPRVPRVANYKLDRGGIDILKPR